jgi:hypothetical protein
LNKSFFYKSLIMSKYITFLFAIAFLFASAVSAQIKTPAPSPTASFTQEIGLIEITAEYSRPGVKGRAIFGDLVPFDKVWRTGANGATKISFSGDVKIQGQELPAGSYAVLSKPGATSWDVHFYTYEGGSWGSYVEKEPALIVSGDVTALPMSVHNFMIMVDNLTANSGSLEFIWDKTLVALEVTTETDAAVMASIEKTLAGPTAADYYAAGSYLYSSGQDLNTALDYVQKATHSDSPRFWQLRMESEILGKLGKVDEAIKVANKSKALAMEAGNDDYVRINEKNIKMWSSK